MADDTLSVPEAAAYLGLGRQTVYDKVRKGELPARRQGTKWLIAVSDLDAYLERSRVGPGQLASVVPRITPRPKGDS